MADTPPWDDKGQWGQTEMIETLTTTIAILSDVPPFYSVVGTDTIGLGRTMKFVFSESLDMEDKTGIVAEYLPAGSTYMGSYPSFTMGGEEEEWTHQFMLPEGWTPPAWALD